MSTAAADALMGIFGFTRTVPAGITGTTNNQERTMPKTRIPKAPEPIRPIIIQIPVGMEKWTKDQIIEFAKNEIENNNTQARELAKVKTEIAKLKFKAKQAKLKAVG